MTKRYDPPDLISTLERSDQHAALWVANARLLLAALSLLVLVFDSTVPNSSREGALSWALTVAGAFFGVALLTRIALARNWVTSLTVLKCGPFIDLALSGMLILSTNGYLSPFTLWIVFTVVETAFLGSARLTMVVCTLGAFTHLLIALVPQDGPLDGAILLVRVSYLAGFAVLIGSVGGILARRNRELAGIEDLGRGLHESPDAQRACATAATILLGVLRASRVEVSFNEIQEASGEQQEVAPDHSWEASDVTVRLWRSQPFDNDELVVGRVMTDRLALAIRRYRLTQTLVESAAREERLRLADEVHDGYLQTLAAATIRLAVARRLSAGVPEAAEEIEVVKQLLRDGTNRARTFLSGQLAEPANGPDRLRSILDERWTGRWDMEIDPQIALSEAQWNVCAMLLREGLNNAASHGRATQAHFGISREGGRVRVLLECNGRPPPQKVRLGFGLTRLSEVLGSQGAGFSLEKGERGGSRLVATFGDYNA